MGDDEGSKLLDSENDVFFSPYLFFNMVQLYVVDSVCSGDTALLSQFQE